MHGLECRARFRVSGLRVGDSPLRCDVSAFGLQEGGSGLEEHVELGCRFQGSGWGLTFG